MPSCVAWLRLDARLGTRRTLAAACIMQAAGTSLPLLSSRETVLFAAAAAVGGTFMGVVAVAMSAGRRHAPGARYNLLAVLTAAYALGQAAGPAMCTFLMRPAGGIDTALAVTAAAALGCAGTAACFPDRDRRRTARAASAGPRLFVGRSSRSGAPTLATGETAPSEQPRGVGWSA